MVQRGMDMYGVVSEWYENRDQRSFPWPSDGGHHAGRKWPILFAGALLDNEQMIHVEQRAQGRFHEDAHHT